LSSRYTDRHPDVRKLKDQIAKTEKMRDQLLAGLKTPAGTNDGTETANPAGPNGDPAQATLMAPIQSQLRSNQLEITNREHAVATLKAKVDDYQGRLNQEPIREQQLADLTRGYEQSQASYDDLLKKTNESKTATKMEVLQQGERFRIIDPPSLPLKPAFPNRLKFCGIGLGVGLALGVVFAGAFEMMDDRIHDEKALQKLLPVGVIAEIPAIARREDERRTRRQLWLGWAVAALVSGTILLGSALSYLRG
jgi:succinoglycan biosynthesis transport protein ExoP